MKHENKHIYLFHVFEESNKHIDEKKTYKIEKGNTVQTLLWKYKGFFLTKSVNIRVVTVKPTRKKPKGQ